MTHQEIKAVIVQTVFNGLERRSGVLHVSGRGRKTIATALLALTRQSDLRIGLLEVKKCAEYLAVRKERTAALELMKSLDDVAAQKVRVRAA